MIGNGSLKLNRFYLEVKQVQQLSLTDADIRANNISISIHECTFHTYGKLVAQNLHSQIR